MGKPGKCLVAVWVWILASVAFPCGAPAGNPVFGWVDPTSGVYPGPGHTLGISPWIQTKRLIAADGTADNYFGSCVSLSGDGNTLIVGANKSTAQEGSAAYVFTRSGGEWIQQAKLTAMGDEAWNFGSSVALSFDGNTALIGAPDAYVNGQRNGAAYVFVRSAGAWSQQAKILPENETTWYQFGISVAVSGDGQTALIGAKNEWTLGGNSAAYVFIRSGNTWIQETRLANPSADLSSFGNTVSLDNTGSTALIGVYRFNSLPGEAYIFVRSGASWIRQATLTASDGNLTFGSRGALSGDGQTALVGSNSIQAYVFTRSGIVWTQQATLAAQAAIEGVALNNAATTALLGVPSATGDSGSYYLGAAHVYLRSGASWAQQSTLTSGIGAFGKSVALSGDGQTVLIGDPWAMTNGSPSKGAAYVYSPVKSRAYLPLVSYPPPTCLLNIENITGGSLCIEIFGTGQGRKCYENGTYFYGSFKADIYSFFVTAICGSLDSSLYFPEGDFTLSFYCRGASEGDATNSQGKP